MVRTIITVRMNTEYWESGKDTCLSSFLNTFVDSWNVFLRNSTTNDCRLEFVSVLAVWIHRCETNTTVTILTTTTRLFCVLRIDFDFFCKCFFVSNLRSTYVCFYVELTKQTVYDNFQVKLTHSGNDCLTGFLISMSTECRIFFSKFCQSFTHFTLIVLCFRLDSKLDNRFREFHGFQNNRMFLITDSITCCCQFETNSCCDISGIYFIQFTTFICVHLQNTSDTLFLSFCCIEYIRTGVQCTGIHTEECQLTNKWVCHNLKCQCCEWLIIRRFTNDFVTIFVCTGDIRDICWCRHVLDNTI